MPTGAVAATGCFSNAGRSRRCGGDAQARPEPPSSVGTGRNTLVETTGHMGFSFAMKGNTQSRQGNMGFPVAGRSVWRSNSACALEARAVEGPGIRRDAGLRAVPCSPKATQQAIDFSAVAEALAVSQVTGTRTNRIDRGQVTTATPAKLDFRTAEAAGEGLRTRFPREALRVSVRACRHGVERIGATENRLPRRSKIDCASTGSGEPEARFRCAARPGRRRARRPVDSPRDSSARSGTA